MKFVVEIQSPRGDIARKEYDAPTMGSVLQAVERELKNFPNFRVTHIQQQGEPQKSAPFETW
jgi:hypothetical protein